VINSPLCVVKIWIQTGRENNMLWFEFEYLLKWLVNKFLYKVKVKNKCINYCHMGANSRNTIWVEFNNQKLFWKHVQLLWNY